MKMKNFCTVRRSEPSDKAGAKVAQHRWDGLLTQIILYSRHLLSTMLSKQDLMSLQQWSPGNGRGDIPEVMSRAHMGTSANNPWCFAEKYSIPKWGFNKYEQLNGRYIVKEDNKRELIE